MTDKQHIADSSLRSIADSHPLPANHTPSAISHMPSMLRQVEKDEEILQAKGTSGQTTGVTPNFESQINSLRGIGQPLPEFDRNFMERRFGVDFSGVRVHKGNNAVQMSRELNAEAFTYGRDIYFGAGRYSPGTSSGKSLLAHELTHVVQQDIGSSVTKISRVVEGDIADRVVEQVMRMPETSMPKTGLIRSCLSCNGNTVINRKAAKTGTKSDLKLLLREIIGLEWMGQSAGKSPIQLTKGMIALIRKVTTLSEADIRLLWTKPPKTPGEVLKNIDHSLPDTISQDLFKDLQDIKMKAVMSGKLPFKAPQKEVPPPSTAVTAISGIEEKEALLKAIVDALKDKKPEDKEKAKEALKKPMEAFFEMEAGKMVKDMLLSTKGLPLTLMVGSAGLAAMIAENTDIPSSPEIPVSDRFSIKFEFEGTFQEPKSIKLILKFTFGGVEKTEKEEKKPSVLALPPEVHTVISKINRETFIKWIVDRAFYEYEVAGPEEEKKEKKFYQFVRDYPDSLPDAQLLATELARKIFAKGMRNRINELKGKEFQKNIYFDLHYEWLWNEFFELKGLAPRLEWLLKLLIPVIPFKALWIEQITFICGKRVIPIGIKKAG